MKKIIAFVSITTMVISCQMNQKQIPYLSTTLSPYSEELGITPSSMPKEFFQIETYAKLETGLDDTKIYIGIGRQGSTSGYWMTRESLLGRSFTTISLKKDDSLNICRDTIRYKFGGDTTMIAFELIHHLSTDKIQYIWLNENNNRSEKAIIISLDHSLREGKKFADLTVERLNGEKLSFSDYVGKTVVVNWWDINCAPCVAEIPGFNKLVEQYKGNSNIVFIAIAQHEKEEVNHFLESIEFNYIQTLANDDAVRLFGKSYPVNIIINSEGIICSFSKGGHEEKYLEIDNIIKKLLE